MLNQRKKKKERVRGSWKKGKKKDTKKQEKRKEEWERWGKNHQ